VIFVAVPKDWYQDEHGNIRTEEEAKINEDTKSEQVFVILGTYESEE
jgi:hypothetical protein